MSLKSSPVDLRHSSRVAIGDSTLGAALKSATDLFTLKREEGLSSVPREQWRQEASRIRDYVLANLEDLVDEFSANATMAGAVVHRAKDASEAGQTILNLLKDNKVKKIVKAKSMVSEEIHLNHLLESHNIEVVETDLGEYIVQIAGETPSHILAPAIHKNRRQVGRLFREKLGVEYSEDPQVLTKIARQALREDFLTAGAGFSGANFAVSSSGSLAIFTNEGNGRMCTAVPPIHIALLTIEKMLPSFKELAFFSRLLTRFATGQTLSSYMSMITGTRRDGDFTGAKKLHIVLLDNGRTEIVKGPFKDILKCIRCSACVNVCPVYRKIGGHAYDTTYSGPMGIVLTNLLYGLERAHTLLDASTLCGACVDVCPVKVPLVEMIGMLREKRVNSGVAPLSEGVFMTLFGLASQNHVLFSAGQRFLRRSWPMIRNILKDLRPDRLPRVSGKTFREY